MKLTKLSRHFYNRDTKLVAQELLGKFIVHKLNGETRIGKIVETEAYVGEHDLACHASKGKTARTEVMFGEPGHAYVYLIYGMYYCLNVVTEKLGHASAVLIRAIEPIKNIQHKTSGPGLLCKALNITKKENKHDLLSDDFYIAENNEEEKFSIAKRPRIGVDYAKHWAKRLLRFYIKHNPFISRD